MRTPYIAHWLPIREGEGGKDNEISVIYVATKNDKFIGDFKQIINTRCTLVKL